MAESVDCSEFCRLCLVKEQVNTPIFEELGDLQQIYTKITACLPIKVSIEDPLPKRICDDCSYKLDQQYQFWNTSLNAEKQLRQWLGLPDETTTTTTKSESSSGRIKKEKDEPVSKRPRRNARRKAAANIRQAAAVAAASDSGPGEDMDLDFAKVENDSDNDLNDNNESLGDSTYMNVGLDDGESGEAGPSGLQKAVAASNSGSTDPNQQGEYTEAKCDMDVKNFQFYFDKKCIRTNKIRGVICKHCKYECDLEQMSFMNGGDEQIIVFTCKVCQKQFDRRRNWYKHYHHLHIFERPYACEICDRRFVNPSSLKTHYKIHSTDKLPCQICGATFKNTVTLYCHQQAHPELARHEHSQCNICKKIFYWPTKLIKHMNTVHSSNYIQPLFKCKLCSKQYKSKFTLDQHTNTHRPDYKSKQFTCEICAKQFSTKQTYRKHINRHSFKKLMCEMCGKQFSSVGSLQNHTRAHIGEKPFQCGYCEKRFTSRLLLRLHERIHTGEKPFKCTVCNKCFTQKCTLTLHMRYHTGERPYQCHLCDKKFISKTFLMTHTRVHHKVIDTDHNITNLM